MPPKKNSEKGILVHTGGLGLKKSPYVAFLDALCYRVFINSPLGKCNLSLLLEEFLFLLGLGQFRLMGVNENGPMSPSWQFSVEINHST